MPTVAGDSQNKLDNLKSLRIAINTARHNAQQYVYTKNGNASPVENDNYAAVIQSLVEFQNAVFTNDWRHPNIGLVGFSDVQSRPRNFSKDNNYILFVFLVKNLQDTTLKQVIGSR